MRWGRPTRAAVRWRKARRARKVLRGRLDWLRGWSGVGIIWGTLVRDLVVLPVLRGWVLPGFYGRIWKQGKRVSHLRT